MENKEKNKKNKILLIILIPFISLLSISFLYIGLSTPSYSQAQMLSKEVNLSYNDLVTEKIPEVWEEVWVCFNGRVLKREPIDGKKVSLQVLTGGDVFYGKRLYSEDSMILIISGDYGKRESDSEIIEENYIVSFCGKFSHNQKVKLISGKKEKMPVLLLYREHIEIIDYNEK